MSMDAVVYSVDRVASSRTHSDTIDIELFYRGGKVRAFLPDNLAIQLLKKMAILLTPKLLEELQCDDVKREFGGGVTETPSVP
jgi:hypothetical protein